MSNAINPPPPNEPQAAAKAPSEAPSVKAARVQWDALENIVAMILATAALYLKLIGPEVWGPIVAAASFGAGALRQLGAKRAGIVSLGLLFASKGLGAVLVHGARHMLVLVAVVLVFSCSGCAGTDLAAEVARVQVPVSVLGQRMAAVKGAIVGLCSVEPQPPQCGELVDAYNAAAEAQRVAAQAVDVMSAAAE